MLFMVLAPVVFLLVLSATAFAIAYRLRPRAAAPPASSGQASPATFPKTRYTCCPRLLTRAEQSLYRVLKRAAGDHLFIAPKVRIADVLQTTQGHSRGSPHDVGLARLAGKHFDFVLCDPTDFRPVCAIELNDRSHARPERQARDRFVAHVCAQAGLPLAWVPVRPHYEPTELREVILQAVRATRQALANP